MSALANNTKRLFQAIDALNHQDSNEKRRRPGSSSPSATLASSKRNAAAAQSQVDIYQSLVECRIMLQRCRNDSNSSCGSSNKNNSAVGTAYEQEQESSQELGLCDQVLGSLLKARDQLNNHQRDDDDDDEEEEEKDPSSLSSSSSSACPRRLLDLLLGDDHDDDGEDITEAISAQLQKAYAADRVAWKEVLDRRHKDVRLHAGAVTSKQFRSLDASFFDQVEASVEHEKTRFNHHNDHNNGAQDEAEENMEEVDTGIGGVDDSRLYQQILKDFVGSSSSVANGLPIRSSSSKKANVDRKASKGRKVRYTEIPKLVHFTFPLSRPETDLETNAWFRSLFGGAVTTASAKTK